MKAKQGCWTCKRRKIGCDKTVPLCQNCTGTGRECLGYGIRLLWPDHHDGRRRDGDWCVNIPMWDPSSRSRFYGQTFLNATFDDVISSKDVAKMSLIPSNDLLKRQPLGAISLSPPVHGQDAHFLSYYEQTISTMISTVQVQNGFRNELLPMALAHSDDAAAALANAMMAVSAVHNWGAEAALPFKARAMRHLMDSFSRNDSLSVTETQAAASMMLCVYNVFDETEGHLHVHLDGARNMLQKLHVGGGQPSDFLLTWFLYHEVLSSFTKPLRLDRGELDLAGLLSKSRIDRSTIVGSLGCSVDILIAIQDINNLRAALIHHSAKTSDTSTIKERSRIDTKLQTLAQHLSSDEEASSGTIPRRLTSIYATAEIYRLAALLYLQRVCPAVSDETTRPTYLTHAFQAVEALDVVSSPWPLFIMACECRTDDQRIQILRTLDEMDRMRGVGNIFVLRRIIENFWTKCDLRADEAGQQWSQLKWWEMLDCDTAMPWFI